MKKTYLFVYLLFCLSLWSCAHSPVDDFNKVTVGDDKEDVLNKAGSPLRSKFKDGKDIWTYRFVLENGYDYKDVVFENQKVTGVKNSPEINMNELERKEKLVEEDIKTQKNPTKLFDKTEKQQKSEKPKIDDAILNQKSTPKKETFVPVE